MDSNSNEYLLFLSENLHDIRRLGTEWGFGDETIDRCAERALNATLPGQPGELSAEKLKEYYDLFKKKTGKKTRISLGVIVFAIAAYFGLILAIDQSAYVAERYRDFEYHLQRYARLFAVPFHGIEKIEEYYSSECIVDNPLYKEIEMDCDLCKLHKSVKQLKTKTPTVKMSLLSYPLLHNGIQPPVSLEDVQDLVKENKASLQGQTVTCTANSVKFASDLARDDLKEQILQEENFSCEWESKERMFLSQILRRLFPRPSVVSREMEVALQKFLYIDGKGSKSRKLPPSVMGGYVWYAQGSGTRTISFSPYKECADICQSFQVTVKEGDIVTFPSDRWKVEVTENTHEISVAFVGFILP